MEQEPVLHVWVHSDNDLIDLTITTTTKGQHGKPAHSTSEVIHTNQKHPFLTIEKGFLPVGQIVLGMHVRRANGKIGVITGWKVVPGTRTMYNLEVAQDHTFTVGDGQWVVHNCGNLSEPGIKNTLSSRGANMVNASDLNLAHNENRVYLGHYGGNGIITNGIDFPTRSLPGLNTLEGFASKYGGKTLAGLPYSIEAMRGPIKNAGEILFNIGRDGLGPGSLTAQEFQFVIETPDILAKTTFLFGATF